jgi:hypothetical protein
MATAVALCGAVIVSQDGRRMVYRKKCESCGHVEPGTTSGSIPSGTLRSSFYCSKCRTRQEISIQGERTTDSPLLEGHDHSPSDGASRTGGGTSASRPPSPLGGSFSGGSGGSTPGDAGVADGVIGLFSLALALPGGAVSGVLGGAVCSVIAVFTKNPFLKDGFDGLFPSLFLLLFTLVFYGLVFAVGGAICGGVGGIVGYAVGQTTRQDVAARGSGAAGGVVLAVFIGMILSAAELPCGTALTILFLACGGCVGGVYWNCENRYAETRKVDPPIAQVVMSPPLPPAASTPRWYYSHAGQTAGPVSMDDVQQMVASGQLQPTDFLLQEGTQTWVPVSAMPSMTSTT